MCVGANIPLSRSDHPLVCQFLIERVHNGVAIPGWHQLQENYLKDVYQLEKTELKTTLANEYVVVIFDKMSDAEGR